jgi:Ca2+-transporting ATPase
MSLAKIFTLKSQKITDIDNYPMKKKELIAIAMWASEHPFDPMEIALHEIYTKVIATDQRPGFKLIHEYPLSGKPPMIYFENKTGKKIIAAKGGSSHYGYFKTKKG